MACTSPCCSSTVPMATVRTSVQLPPYVVARWLGLQDCNAFVQAHVVLIGESVWFNQLPEEQPMEAPTEGIAGLVRAGARPDVTGPQRLALVLRFGIPEPTI